MKTIVFICVGAMLGLVICILYSALVVASEIEKNEQEARENMGNEGRSDKESGE